MADQPAMLSHVNLEVEGEAKQPEQKTKSQLKAERRAKQDAQRAAKLKLKEAQGGGKATSHESNKQPTKQPAAKPAKQQTKPKTDCNEQKKSVVLKEKQCKKEEGSLQVDAKNAIFSHLKSYDRISCPTSTLSYSSSPVHPAFVKLGVQMAKEVIVGSNARCAALICAVKIFIRQYRCPKSKEIRSHLNTSLKPCFNYLRQCRLFSVSMENFVKSIKHTISNICPDISLDEAKEELLSACEEFFEHSIYLAAQAITTTTINRIKDGDCILVYQRSQLILRILLAAKAEGKRFSVTVVDSRPDLRGINTCEVLTEAGIQCSYAYINSTTYVMKDQVTKVILSSDGLLANGYVLGPIGTAMIAMIAHQFNKPVIVCCETYKFSERVQTDSILFNELADPDDLLKTKDGTVSCVANWKDSPHLNLVNLVYDATPPNLVTIVITEIAELPCTSAPVILRRDTERRC